LLTEQNLTAVKHTYYLRFTFGQLLVVFDHTVNKQLCHKNNTHYYFYLNNEKQSICWIEFNGPGFPIKSQDKNSGLFRT